MKSYGNKKMAGITQAKQLVNQNKNNGRMIGTGWTINQEHFILIKLKSGEVIHQIDYGSDLSIHDSCTLGERVRLDIIDEYSAEWVSDE